MFHPAFSGMFYFYLHPIMKKIVFTEEFCSPENLFPFTLTRQVQDIRIGLLTIREKWELALECSSFDKYEGDYKDLDRSFVLEEQIGNDTIYLIHGNILPSSKLIKQVKKIKGGDLIMVPDKEAIIYCITKKEIIETNRIKVKKSVEANDDIKEICFPWDINRLNAWAINEDINLVKKIRSFQKPSSTNKLIAPQNIFIEKGARVEHCIINAEEGPVYISKGALVMEGCCLRGPIAIGEKAVIKMGAKIYGATSIGPNCIVGGEIKNSVFFGNSNKAHDGYIGDSVIGEWCNLGAGTSNSNIKNNASDVMVYTPQGLQNAGKKCGVFMGDFSRTAINTSFNTGTVVGVSANVYGAGLSPKYIPNFSWGYEGIERYDLEKALRDIEKWKEFKNEKMSGNETTILKHIFDHYE
jgi:UDP-N-acetylglucosamine diphosphorylase / glucose-1-phosphate thymidylyltransferase / UDP-N-acetylgalactosamine diphosphorylase / glucosamine-1-phosphate N-acetyltransferase / galactosamine-1-phosphate N-acetyltransferase